MKTSPLTPSILTMRRTLYWTAAVALSLAVTMAHADEPSAGQASLSTGFDYSSGKYGLASNTDIWSVPVTLGYMTDRWSFKLTVPYININGPSNVIPGVGVVSNQNPRGRGRGRGAGSGTGTGTGTGTVVTRGSASGIGDVIASAGYAIVQSSDHSFGVDLTGQVKFGTADADKGLGTGKNDYGISLDGHKTADNWTAFGGVGWTDYGSSQYIKLKNGINANVGVSYKLDRQNSVGAYYYYRERIAVGGGAQSEVAAFWNHRVSNALRLQVYALGGFADGSPDYGAGANFKYNF